MLKVKLTKIEKKKILNGLFDAGYWISEVAEPIGTKRGGGDKFEPHIEYMLEAIDKAHDLIANLK